MILVTIDFIGTMTQPTSRLGFSDWLDSETPGIVFNALGFRVAPGLLLALFGVVCRATDVSDVELWI